MMNVKLFFNRTLLPTFGDWIVVGLNNRIECRQKGNGDLQYVVDIPLVTEPCGTKMVQLDMVLHERVFHEKNCSEYFLDRIWNV